MPGFSAPHLTNDEEARKFLVALRWPNGPVCPHCGVVGHAYQTKRLGKTGKVPAFGTFRCAEKECRKDFSVTTGTVMERSHIPLHKWMQGFYLMTASKKGVSSHQLHRTLGITYKAAWFMAHRIREAMKVGGLGPVGGEGKEVEMDETYFGNVDKANVKTERTRGGKYLKKGRSANKRAVVSLVERGGSVRSFHVTDANKAMVTKIIIENIDSKSRLNTDESRLYGYAKEFVASHDTVKHSAYEYARREGERVIHTNTIEGYFSIFKRGMKGVYQHCKEKHLQRYLTEFDFRYNHREAVGINDDMRARFALKAIEGKRLTYRQPN
jgi:transposase-like protein